jgi:hypothetical protein
MFARRVTAIALVSTIALVGCKKKEEDKAGAGGVVPKEASSLAAAAGANDLAAFLKDENAPLTPEMEEKLLLGLKDCAMTETAIDDKCEGLKAWNKSRGRKTAAKQVLGGSSSLGAKYIGNESPAIRYKAADLLSSLFGADPGTQKLIVESANKEKVPAVLANMIQAVGSRHKGNEDIKALLMKGADHESERVRTESLGWFLTSFGADVPGTFEKAADKLDKDPSMKVRSHVCGRLYGSGNEKAIPLFDKYLNDKNTPPDLYRACFDGVIAAWTGFPKPENPNQKAYELTMKQLESPTRTKDRPPFGSISTLRASKTEFKSDDSFGQKWLDKVKGWYKKERLLKALESIASDSNANWISRSSCVDTMKELGAPKGTFEKLQKKYEKADKGEDSHIKKKLDDVLKTM